MKILIALLILWPSLVFSGSYCDQKSYGGHTTACTATAVASTNANRSGPFTSGCYLIYGYTSAMDFTGISIKALAGGSTVTVASQEGVKFAPGEKQIWYISNNNYLSAQTGSGSGFYDVCRME